MSSILSLKNTLCLWGMVCAGFAVGCETDNSPNIPTDTDSMPSPSDSESGDVVLRGPCPEATRLGGFEVTIYEDYSVATGGVWNGPRPAAVPNITELDSRCRLFRRRNLHCEPGCQPGETCNDDGTCIDDPRQQDVGTVAIDGAEQLIEMHPSPPENHYANTNLPHPIFLPGKKIQMTTTPGYIGSVVLSGIGVAPLVLTPKKWIVSANQALLLRWIPPVIEKRATIQFRLNLDQHGITPLTLICNLPDTGAADIPAVYINALLNDGVSGFANGDISRQTTDSVQLSNGCVEFQVRSPTTGDVEIVESVTPRPPR